MSFEMNQKTSYKGNDWWKWSVWVEAPPRELDTIKAVIYVLHPTFRNRKRRVEDRATKFRLDSSGWGGFTIRIQIELKDGSRQRLTHELVLNYPAPAQPSSSRAGKTRKAAGFRIFLSSSAAEGDAATLVKETLKKQKVELLDYTELKSGVPWTVSLMQAIQKSDAIIALASEEPSVFVSAEMEAARRAGIPIIRVNPQDGAVVIEGQVPDKLASTAARSEGRAPSRLTDRVLTLLSGSIQKRLSKPELISKATDQAEPA